METLIFLQAFIKWNLFACIYLFTFYLAGLLLHSTCGDNNNDTNDK